jgi:hypothetical protein
MGWASARPSTCLSFPFWAGMLEQRSSCKGSSLTLASSSSRSVSCQIAVRCRARLPERLRQLEVQPVASSLGCWIGYSTTVSTAQLCVRIPRTPLTTTCTAHGGMCVATPVMCGMHAGKPVMRVYLLSRGCNGATWTATLWVLNHAWLGAICAHFFCAHLDHCAAFEHCVTAQHAFTSPTDEQHLTSTHSQTQAEDTCKAEGRQRTYFGNSYDWKQSSAGALDVDIYQNDVQSIKGESIGAWKRIAKPMDRIVNSYVQSWLGSPSSAACQPCTTFLLLRLLPAEHLCVGL